MHVGCAGWSLSGPARADFADTGTHLSRYAARLSPVEINSSFYRRHRAASYARWAESVPPGFRFSVKLPRAITHERRLLRAEDLLDGFLVDVAALGDRLGCVLVQLPPGLRLEPGAARGFFEALRERFGGDVAAEPRHRSWFTAEAGELLSDFRIARVAADPARAPRGGEPGGWPGLVYYRLHGWPRVYYSPYESSYLQTLAGRFLAGRLDAVARGSAPTPRIWCIFDNTVLGAALPNALELLRTLGAAATISEEARR